MLETAISPGTLLGGKFRVERLLGAGAMGAVYAVVHELTRHRRALKLLHASSQANPEVVRRFLNEASAAGRVGNAHIVEAFDAGTLPGGEPYVVMELLEGEPMRALLDRTERLDAGLAAELVAQAAEGVAAAHKAGIIHRDLKPDNLFVTKRAGRPFVKIMDFGVSKFATESAVGARSTQSGMIFGSPAYMSPEQITGQREVDARSDVFALGLVLYECLTGVLPFEAQSFQAVLMRVLGDEPVPVHTIRPDVPKGLSDVIERALQKQPDARYQSADELCTALLAFARPDSPTPSEVPSAPRHSPVSTLAPAPSRMLGFVAGALILLGGVIAAAWVASRPAPVAAPTVGPRVLPSAVIPAAVATHVDAGGPAPAVLPPLGELPPEPAAASVAAKKRAVRADAPPPAAPLAPPSPPSATRARELGLREDNPFQ